MNPFSPFLQIDSRQFGVEHQVGDSKLSGFVDSQGCPCEEPEKVRPVVARERLGGAIASSRPNLRGIQIVM
jgi:hypothetical protein